jgi:NADH-quinone oxidoreductase subunit L
MNNPEQIGWFILLLPLVAAAVITLFTQRDAKFSAQLSIIAVVVSFLISLFLFFTFSAPFELKFDWMSVGDLKIDFGIKFDPLSRLMLLIVTGVASVIHIYSFGYMREDRSMARFFASLSLFTFSMLGIVLANNLVMMFIFWELVGLSSYLLIGFWYEKPSAADAAKKAFLTNRLGDFGFILGIILVWATLGTANLNGLNFDQLRQKLAADPSALGNMATIAGLLLFCGAMGKSAQFPLHVWLPDAMEGPTPVSALIHAATMVAAGVYMLCRVYFIYAAPQAWPVWAPEWLQGITALGVIAWIGCFTALLAALIAVQQNDIKRILAYSTLSQLGYMVMAVGLGGPTAAMYHLTTHAFFKAMLFLGAGAVIHACHHEQDIWNMGGLKKKMPATYWTFLIGTLALAGVPPLSGFYSKDEILALASDSHPIMFIIAVFVAVLTTFYMFRLIFVAFLGTPRSEEAEHAHEAPAVMKWPLIVLAVPSVIAGFWGINHFLAPQFSGEEVHRGSWFDEILAPFGHAPLAALAGLAAVVFGYSFARALYLNATVDPIPHRLGLFARAMRNRFYFDELYTGLIRVTHEALAKLADWLDRWIIGGLGVRGVQGTTEVIGRASRLVQTGNLQTYAFVIVLGLAVVLYLFLNF